MNDILILYLQQLNTKYTKVTILQSKQDISNQFSGPPRYEQGLGDKDSNRLLATKFKCNKEKS